MKYKKPLTTVNKEVDPFDVTDSGFDGQEADSGFISCLTAFRQFCLYTRKHVLWQTVKILKAAFHQRLRFC